MGVDAQDYDNDGWPDIHMTALAGETFPLFRNDTHGAFIEETQLAGRLTTVAVGPVSLVADMNNDGWKDLHGQLASMRALVISKPSRSSNPQSVSQRWAWHFSDVSDVAGLALIAAHRGWVADFDGVVGSTSSVLTSAHQPSCGEHDDGVEQLGHRAIGWHEE
jgi:hypothetical protein